MESLRKLEPHPIFFTDPNEFIPKKSKYDGLYHKWGLPHEDYMSLVRRYNSNLEAQVEVRFVKGLIDRKLKQLEEQRSQVQDFFNRDFIIKIVLDYHGKAVPNSSIIWRKFRVSGGMTLANFADRVLLPVMGWTRGIHLYQIQDVETDGALYGAVNRSAQDWMHLWFNGFWMVDDAKVRLAEIFNKEGQKLHFEYDLGLHFTHVLSLVEILPADESNGSVECLDGQLACIPDSFGGGFAEDYPAFLADYRSGAKSSIVRSGLNCASESSNYVEGHWDPLRFDKNEANARLAKALGSIASVGPSVTKKAIPTSSTGTDEDLQCDLCGSTKDLKLCGLCKQVRYCSVECQRKAWPTHKAVCKKR